jgi:hypothetical protein
VVEAVVRQRRDQLDPLVVPVVREAVQVVAGERHADHARAHRLHRGYLHGEHAEGQRGGLHGDGHVVQGKGR